jgi:hypothetical protein
MKTKMDAKSALCGLIVGIVAVTTMAAVENASQPVGRYQAAAASGFVVILDTQTGKAWGSTTPGVAITHEGFWEKKFDK